MVHHESGASAKAEEYNGAPMNDRQTLALNHVVTDTGNLDNIQRYARTLVRGVRRFGTILTVDFVKKEFFWHACVSLLNPESKPIPIKKLSSMEKAVTLRLASELLGDVGRPDSEKTHEDEKSIHITRALTIEEERRARRALNRKDKDGQ
jgi:hypothetical protein